MLKRIIAATLAGCMMLLTLTACGGDKTETNPAATSSVASTEATTPEDATSSSVSTVTASGNETTESKAAANASKQANANVSTQANGATPQGDTSAAATDNSAKIFKLWWGNDDESMLAAIADYRKKHPEVTFRPVTPTNYTVAQLKTEIAAGTEPNIVMLDHVYITALGNGKQILDLNKFGAKSLKSKYIGSCWDGVSYDGHVYGLPHNGNTIALMYNKDMLDAANQKAPTTYEQLRNVGKQVTKYIDGDLQKGEFAFTSPFNDVADQGRQNWSAFVYFFWLWRNGGDILNANNTKAIFNSTAGINALTQLQTLVKDGVCSTTYMESQFYNGTIGMIEMGNWSIPSITAADSNAEFGVAMLPTLKKGVPQYSGLGLYALGITSKTKNPEVAYDFLKDYTTNTTYQIQYGKQHNQLPVLKAALNDSYYKGTFWPTYIKQYALSKSRPGVDNWDKIESTIAEAVNQVINGGANPKDSLNRAASRVNAYLK